MRVDRTSIRSKSITAYLLLVSLLAVVPAYWGPWVGHNTAALRLSGQDLGEFVKFIPEIRRGQSHFPRQLFYLPPLACCACLAAIAANRHLPYPRWLRLGMLFLALLVLPGLLPPAWGHPRELFTAEFVLQGLAFMLGVLLVLAHGLFRRVPPVPLAVALGVLALIGLVPAQWAFWAIRPRIWAVYDTPTIYLGWGLWLMQAAWFAVWIAAFRLSRFRQTA